MSLEDVDATTALCGERFMGHVCTIPRTGHHGREHRCFCSKAWVTPHDYERGHPSGAGTCWCGRIEAHPLHAAAR